MYKVWLLTLVLMVGPLISAGTPWKRYKESNLKKVKHPYKRNHKIRSQSIDVTPSKAPELENFTKNGDCSLMGTWINSLGSEVMLNVTEDGQLIGKYMTAVEATEGAAGDGYAKIIGHASPGGRHRTFGFTVNWNEGTSTTSWTGQCFVCDGQEVLKATWILTSEKDKCDENWLANRIGQDNFVRRL